MIEVRVDTPYIEILAGSPQCKLGEGLCAQGERVAWVDILDKKLFIYRESVVSVVEAPIVISKVLCIVGDEYKLLSENGLAIYSMTTKSWTYSSFIFGENYRSNDGCLLADGRVLIGVMSVIDPSKYAGSIWLYDNGKYEKVLSDIFIPNSFVNLNADEILITDSLLQETKRYQLKDNQLLVGREFYKSQDVSTPDGACLYDGFIYMALWGGNCLGKFDLDGKLISKICVPFQFPTSVSVSNDWVYVTSAMCGYSENHNKINDGKTLRFKLSEAVS